MQLAKQDDISETQNWCVTLAPSHAPSAPDMMQVFQFLLLEN
jgi:hypothetical protein